MTLGGDCCNIRYVQFGKNGSYEGRKGRVREFALASTGAAHFREDINCYRGMYIYQIQLQKTFFYINNIQTN